MGVITEYLRLDADELAELRLLLDEEPDRAFDYVSELAEQGDDLGLDDEDDEVNDEVNDEVDDEVNDEVNEQRDDRDDRDADFGEGFDNDLELTEGGGRRAQGADDEDDEQYAPRYMDTAESWAAIEFMLAKLDPPVNAVSGGVRLTDEQWGDGSPRLLEAEQVRSVARFLDSVPVAQFEASYDPRALTASDIYPGSWDEDWAADYICYYYENLVDFFRAAATAGDNVLVWGS